MKTPAEIRAAIVSAVSDASALRNEVLAERLEQCLLPLWELDELLHAAQRMATYEDFAGDLCHACAPDQPWAYQQARNRFAKALDAFRDPHAAEAAQP